MERSSTGATPSLIRRILITIGKCTLFAVLGILFIFLLALPIRAMISADQANALDANITAETPIWLLILTYAIFVLGFFAALYIVRILISRQTLASAGLGTIRWAREFGEGWILGTLLVTIGYLLMILSGTAESQGWLFIPGTFLGWLLLFLIQPFFEELLFRGYLMSILARYFNLPVAIIISSVAFAVVHASNDGFSIIGLMTITAAGGLFALLFLKSGQLWLPTGMHAAWNFTQGVVFGFPTSGVETYALTSTTTSGPDWLSGGAFGFEGSLLALLLIIAAIWWYRQSFKEERLTPLLTQSLSNSPEIADNNILDDHIE